MTIGLECRQWNWIETLDRHKQTMQKVASLSVFSAHPNQPSTTTSSTTANPLASEKNIFSRLPQ